MLISSERPYGAWNIYTSCREDNLDDWQPGQPIRYLGGGFAEFRWPHQEPDVKWRATNRLNYSKVEHFFTAREAHDAAERDLRERIDGLKVL